MGFWKNDVPDIISLKKDEQGFITIEHSQGVFKMHESEVRDISLVKDARSKPKNYNNIIILVISFLCSGGSQNIISQIISHSIDSHQTRGDYIAGYGRIFGLDNNPIILVAFLSVQFIFQFICFYVLFNWKKQWVYFLFDQEKDILLLNNTSRVFRFRFKYLSQIKSIIPEFKVLEKNNKLKTLWFVLCISLLLVILLFFNNIPFWYEVFLDNLEMGLLPWKDYQNYRESEINILKLFFDGIVSNLLLLIIICLSVLFFIIAVIIFATFLSLPKLLCDFVVAIVLRLDRKRFQFNLDYLNDATATGFFLQSCVASVLVLLNAPIKDWKIFLLISFIVTTLIYSLFLAIVYFDEYRKNKNHEE
jgi:hypothetical protein